MKKFFDLSIDSGWLVKKNEIVILENYEKCNLLDLDRVQCRKSTKRKKAPSLTPTQNIMINHIEKNGKAKFIFEYREYDDETSNMITEIKKEIDTLIEVEEFLETSLQGRFYIKLENVKYYYLSLKVTAGWYVKWNHLFFKKRESNAKSLLKIEPECLIQDIACFQYRTNSEYFYLDVGYPEGCEDKEIYVQLIKGEDWLDPVVEYRSRDMLYLVEKMNEIFFEITCKEKSFIEY